MAAAATRLSLWRVIYMNEINLTGLHTVRSAGALNYGQAASAQRERPSVSVEPEPQLDQVNIGLDLTYSDSLESVTLASESAASQPSVADSFTTTASLAKHGLTSSEFDGFLIADAPAAAVNRHNQVKELAVSSLGTIALIDDIQQPSDLQSSSVSSTATIDEAQSKPIGGIEIFLNGPSTISEGIYNTDGVRIA